MIKVRYDKGGKMELIRRSMTIFDWAIVFRNTSVKKAAIFNRAS